MSTLFDLPTTQTLWEGQPVTSSPPVVAPANSSVIDKLRATGMTDDQIVTAIIGFGQQQTNPAPAPLVSASDYIGQMRQQGYTDEQITASVVAAALVADNPGSGDPTAAGGVSPAVDNLSGRIDEHAGNVSNVVTATAAHAERIAGVESDINDHGDLLNVQGQQLALHNSRLGVVEAWLDEHGTELETLLGSGKTDTVADDTNKGGNA